MKKVFFATLTLYWTALSFGQTLLVATDLELKKASTHHQALNAVNLNTNEVFVFASDKERLTGIKYNNALFFKDSLTTNRPDNDFDRLAGYSFDEEKNPEIYWLEKNFKKLHAVSFDFQNRKISSQTFEISLEKEVVLSSFSENNTFYILSVLKTEEVMKLYIFQNGKMKEKFIDFSEYKIVDRRNNPLKLWSLVEEAGFEKMEIDELNPLFHCTSKGKFYVFNDKIILTFDHKINETQVFEIDLNNYQLSERKIPQETLKKVDGNSNSYFSDGKLYQLKNNKEELLFVVKDFKSGNLIQNFSTKKEENIAYKNSDLFSQTGSQPPKKFKNTKKFLETLYFSGVGISVYETPLNSFITIGGERNVASTGGMILGVGYAMISGGEIDDSMINGDLQMNYFETHLDLQSKYFKKEQEVLATDYIGQFLNQTKNISLASAFRYKNYYILGYYDEKAKKYVLRKFQDDFID